MFADFLMANAEFTWWQLGTFFAVGTFWFWALFVLANVLLFVATETEQGWLGTICLVGFFAVLQFFGGEDIIGYLWHHPIRILSFLAVYFGIGTVWTTAKWWLYVRKERGKYDVAKVAFLQKKGLQPPEGQNYWDMAVPEDLIIEWSEALSFEHNINPHPQVIKHKAAVTRWMSYWPWSMLYTICNDAVRQICEQIVNGIKGYLQAISDSVWGNVRKEFLTREALDAKRAADLNRRRNGG